MMKTSDTEHPTIKQEMDNLYNLMRLLPADPLAAALVFAISILKVIQVAPDLEQAKKVSSDCVKEVQVMLTGRDDATH